MIRRSNETRLDARGSGLIPLPPAKAGAALGPFTRHVLSRELMRQVRRYEPCLPRPAKEPPAGPRWIHEIKHDGFRILAELNAGGCKANHAERF